MGSVHLLPPSLVGLTADCDVKGRGAEGVTESERSQAPQSLRKPATSGEDGLHLEWTSIGQPESVPMEIIFDNRFLLGDSRVRGFVFQDSASARCEKEKRLWKLL
ncbi:unnamed protein product [Gulo gulo]|uniref:Uncharacterized protein n=1 Tax=Gulo gulo TaxID=48420 RepID=A0A9X9M607_GULGU|nr:unnamed protein product [Gulo gulo]